MDRRTRRTRRSRFVAAAAVACGLLSGCTRPPTTGGATAAAGEGEVAFAPLAQEILEETFATQPTQATYLGVHDHDGRIEDWSRAAIETEVARLAKFRARLVAIAPALLSPARRLDREQLLHALDSRTLTLQVVRPWATNPDVYASGMTNSAYLLIKRSFAPPDVRLRSLIERERAMPAALAEARRNLEDPPRILTEIALEQIGGNRDFFRTAVPAAFAAGGGAGGLDPVKDAALLAEFAAANAAVVAAFDAFEAWLRDDLLPRSRGEFALGESAWRQKLWADEMIDLPIAELLRIAEADLRTNQAAFARCAAAIDASRPPAAVLAALQDDGPAAADLLATTQAELDGIARFISARRILTIPDAPPARVQETPPFLRALTSASMDTPGPWEHVATEAYYSMTLPDPAWPAEQQREFMTQWYYAMITNVSVHEVWPGHYLQFLHASGFPSDVRKVFGAATNVEGWAHYCEQMMLDEGFHAGEPKYRLAQLQDALLRDCRFVVGIRMHTQGMTVAAAQEYFEQEAWQPAPVARAEAWRGVSDPTYGYYTLGKLMILKLREDVRARDGARFTLQRFHDEFLELGPLPLPLIRRAMLGEAGEAL